METLLLNPWTPSISDAQKARIPLGSQVTQPYTDGSMPTVYRKVSTHTWQISAGPRFVGQVVSSQKGQDGYYPATAKQADTLDAFFLSGQTTLPAVSSPSAGTYTGRPPTLYGTRTPPAPQAPPVVDPSLVVVDPSLVDPNLVSQTAMITPGTESVPWWWQYRFPLALGVLGLTIAGGGSYYWFVLRKRAKS